MKYNSSKMTILYAEDNCLIQSTMISFLSNEGFNILIADNGAQAIQYIFDDKQSIDALIADVDLGAGANGWEVAGCARLRNPTMPVIYTSSVSEEDWIANGVPFSRLCTKPFRPSHVLAALTSLMVVAAPEHLLVPALVFPGIQTMTQMIPEARQIIAPQAPSLEEGKAVGRNPWVVGPLGQKLYRSNLPAANCQWTSRRKAEVVAALAGNLISPDELQTLYGLSTEELAGWQRAIGRFGVPGLKQTRAKHYRELQQKTQSFGWSG